MLGYLIVVVLFLLVLLFIGWQIWIKVRKPKPYPFPDAWKKILETKVSFYQQLSGEEKHRFELEVQYFLDHVSVNGVEITIDDTDRLLVASSAVIPLFGFPQLRYRNIDEVLLYKGTFNAENQTEGKDRNIVGKVGSGNMHRLMILSLPALHEGFANENSPGNVGIHEFVHLIDKADGSMDGIPESLLEKQYLIPWLQQIHEGIKEIKLSESDINPYGATSEIEFFSVASEYFFKQPDKFEVNHPELYELMVRIYRQEPE